jgi:uncharacterized protein (TIGR02246 family)
MHRSVGADGPTRLVQLSDHDLVDGVEPRGTVERDERHTGVRRLEAQRRRHVPSPLLVPDSRNLAKPAIVQHAPAIATAAVQGSLVMLDATDLHAREAIRDLVARYNSYGDSGLFDRMLELFAPDASLEVDGVPHEGHAAIRAVFTGVRDHTSKGRPGPAYLRHCTSTHQIDLVDESTATGRCYFLVLTAIGLDHWGRYLDEYRVVDSEWRFARRRVVVDDLAPQSVLGSSGPDRSSGPDKGAEHAGDGELLQRLRHLEDMDEIRRLYVDYGRHLDAGDPAAYASLFTRDAKLRLGRIMRADGREEIERVAATVIGSDPDGARRSAHVLGAPRVELRGNSASGDAVWVAILRSETGPPSVSVGRHVDTLLREEGRWRFAERRGFVDVGTVD